jgi:hypothetical protein
MRQHIVNRSRHPANAQPPGAFSRFNDNPNVRVVLPNIKLSCDE